MATAVGREQARAFIHVDASSLDRSAIAGSQVVLMPASDGMVTDQATLVACSLAGVLTASGEITGTPPEADCSLRADVSRRDDGAWTVPLSVFAGSWAAGHNSGLAILPNPDTGPALFTVSLDSTKTSLHVPAAPPVQAAPVVAAEDPADSPANNPVPSLDTGETSVITPLAPTLLEASEAPLIIAPLASPAQGLGDTVASDRMLVAAGNRGGARSPHPPPPVILVPVLLAAGLLWARSRRPVPGWTAIVTVPTGAAWKVGVCLAALLCLMTFDETTIYKLGLVAIAFVAAIGLHLLVNWTGELSLAHAGFIGVPAFAVAQFSSNTGLSPILGLPVAVAVGVLLGALVGVAALRSRGLQVALVTLAVGIAVGQFLFFRTWVVGPAGGLQMPVPSLFGLELRTSRALAPVLATVVLLAVLAASSIMRSKIGRALLLVRSDPDAAAAAGVAVARHRAMAYGLAGGFAGLAGWSYVVWVQQVSAKAFPLQLGFTYLVIAALAGPGGLGGVVASAGLIQGGALFSFLPRSVALYLAPLALIINVTRYQQGFNGVLRATRTALQSRIGAVMTTDSQRPQAHGNSQGAVRELRLPVVLGTLVIVAGFSAIVLAWYHMGNTDSVWVQNQELMSGGVVGLGLIVLGATLLLRDALLVGRSQLVSPAAEPVLTEMATPPSNVIAAPSNGTTPAVPARPPRRTVRVAAEDAG